MSIIKREGGKVEYQLESDPAKASYSILRASNRQKKMLRFFKVPFNANISFGAAGWEIGTIMSSDKHQDQWRRYIYLTKDFDSDTDLLKPFEESVLKAIEIPEGWSMSDADQEFRDELIKNILHDESPFDRPEPVVRFPNVNFMFTGKFTFGNRKACQDAVVTYGSLAPDHKSVSRFIDFLVIGAEGSTTWKRGTYGNKIEAAILARREFGSPAIISEKHWVNSLNKSK